MNPRAAAALAVSAVVADGLSLSVVLPRYLEKVAEKDRALLQELAYGTLRWHPKLDAYLRKLLDKPLKAKDADIHALMACGIYQLLFMRTPEHAAVSETVAATKALKKKWANKLVNAVLRRFLRERATLDKKLSGNPEFSSAHPQWLLDQWREAWPEKTGELIAANNSRPPMTLRVNTQKTSREAYLQQLANAGISASACQYSPAGIQLAQPADVPGLPGFNSGLASVQDEAAQLSAILLEPHPNQHILDACCAPGGKTGHILEHLAGDAELTAIDINSDRLERVEENLERLDLRAQVIACDAAATSEWWDGRQFDRILLDAPCSATGVIRRHPDIKLLRTPSDIDKLADIQLSLLSALWPLLNTGGILLYATCSTLPRENDNTVRRFLSEHNDVDVMAIETDAGQPTAYGRQLLPQQDGHDGFFYAKLRKKLRNIDQSNQ